MDMWIQTGSLSRSSLLYLSRAQITNYELESPSLEQTVATLSGMDVIYRPGRCPGEAWDMGAEFATVRNGASPCFLPMNCRPVALWPRAPSHQRAQVLFSFSVLSPISL